MIVFWYMLALFWTGLGAMSNGAESLICFCIATVFAVGARVIMEIRKC